MTVEGGRRRPFGLWVAVVLLGATALLEHRMRARAEDHTRTLVEDGSYLVGRVDELEAGAADLARQTLAEAARRERAERDREAAVASLLAARRQAYDLGFEAARLALEAGDLGAARRRLGALPEDLRGFEVGVLEGALGRRVLRLEGHEGLVFCLASSADGRRLASGGYDGVVRVWDRESGAVLAELRGHDGDLLDVALDGDGSRVASSGDDDTLRLWSVADGAELARIEVDERVWSVDLDDTGTVLASADDLGALVIRGGEDWSPQAEYLHPGGSACQTLALDASGKLVAAGFEDGSLTLWRPGGAREPLAFQAHDEWIAGVALSPDGRRVASGAGDGSAAWFDTADGRRLGELAMSDGVGALAFEPGGAILVTGSFSGGLTRWALPGPVALDTLSQEGRVERVAALPGGAVAFTAGDDALHLWQPRARLLPTAVEGRRRRRPLAGRQRRGRLLRRRSRGGARAALLARRIPPGGPGGPQPDRALRRRRSGGRAHRQRGSSGTPVAARRRGLRAPYGRRRGGGRPGKSWPSPRTAAWWPWPRTPRYTSTSSNPRGRAR